MELLGGVLALLTEPAVAAHGIFHVENHVEVGVGHTGDALLVVPVVTDSALEAACTRRRFGTVTAGKLDFGFDDSWFDSWSHDEVGRNTG